MIPREDLTPFIKKYFSHFATYGEVWEFIQNHPGFVKEIEKEIDEAVTMFNTYRKSKEHEIKNISLPSSSYCKAILKEDLPTCETLIGIIDESDDKELVEKIIMEMSQFDFIDALRPVENCAAALLLGSYRCAMRIMYPYIKAKNVQIASSLEEMIGLMAIDGNKTKLFSAVKHWYKDYEEEGFSKELAEAVQKL